MNIEKYIYNENNNNISDLISLYKDGFLDKLLIKKSYNIKIKAILIKNCKEVDINYQIISNLDKYISYVKNTLLIDQLLIRYIVSLTINNKYNRILKSNKYFPDNSNIYNQNFEKMLFLNYKKNYSLLKKYNIKFHDNNELIDIINRHKKKAFVYFEIINKQNLNFYFNIIDYIEST